MKLRYQYALVLLVAAFSKPLLAEKLGETDTAINKEEVSSTSKQEKENMTKEELVKAAQKKRKNMTKEEREKEVDRLLNEAFKNKSGKRL